MKLVYLYLKKEKKKKGQVEIGDQKWFDSLWGDRWTKTLFYLIGIDRAVHVNEFTRSWINLSSVLGVTRSRDHWVFFFFKMFIVCYP